MAISEWSAPTLLCHRGESGSAHAGDRAECAHQAGWLSQSQPGIQASMVLVLLYLVRFSLVNQWILELVCVYIVIMDTNSV